jgi:hypothetical protein
VESGCVGRPATLAEVAHGVLGRIEHEVHAEEIAQDVDIRQQPKA